MGPEHGSILFSPVSGPVGAFLLGQRVGCLSQLRLREVDRAIRVSLGLSSFEI